MHVTKRDSMKSGQSEKKKCFITKKKKIDFKRNIEIVENKIRRVFQNLESFKKT